MHSWNSDGYARSGRVEYIVAEPGEPRLVEYAEQPSTSTNDAEPSDWMRERLTECYND